MTERPLNDRQEAALTWLHQNTAPPPPGSPSWAVPSRTVYAFSLVPVLVEQGLMERSRHSSGYRRESNSAANTLVALKRRGYAANDGGGAWLQAKWWITVAGQEASR